MGAERRSTPRREFSGGYLPPTTRIRPGTEVTVVNLSASGALIEGTVRLRPGGHYELCVDLPARTITIAALVRRAFVARLDARFGMRYRAALEFEFPVPWPVPADLLDEYRLPDADASVPAAGVANTRRAASGPHDGGTGAPTPAISPLSAADGIRLDSTEPTAG